MARSIPDRDILSTGSQLRINPDNALSRPWPEDRVAYCIFLDQIEVICGASRKQAMHGIDDLIVGDLFRLPSIDPKNRSCIGYKNNRAIITLETSIEVGRADMDARRIGSVVLMSGNAHTLGADLLQLSEGRIILALGGQTRAQESYTLIHLSETHPAKASPHPDPASNG